MKNLSRCIKTILNWSLCFMLTCMSCLICHDTNAQEAVVPPALDNLSSIESNLKAIDPHRVSLEECVMFSIYNSFEVQLAKLDLYVTETDLMYEEAVFDAFIYGGASYVEDKRQQLSVFAADDKQTNEYYLEITKTLPTGTELSAKWGDERSWSNTTFTTKNPAHSAELLLEAVQPVGKNFFGYVDRGKVTLAKLAIENADFEMKNKIEDFIAKVEKLYWELVFEKKSLEIFEDIFKRAEKLYESDKKNFNIGLIEKVDLYNSEANLEKRRAEFILSKNAYRRAEEDLKLAMNLSDEKRLYPKEFLDFEYVGKDLSDCLKEAFEKRMDYKIKKKDVDILGLDLKIKENEKWPEIDLNASLAMNGVEGKFKKAVGKTTVADNTYYYAGIEVTLPVENREARSEYKRVKFEKDKAIVNLKDIERTIITEVGNSVRNIASFQASLVYFGKAVDLQSEKLAEEEKRFAFGRSSTKRIIDYQQDLLRAELENATFLLKHRKAKVDLDKTMGIIYYKYEDVI